MAKLLQPEVFADLDLVQEIEDYYQEFYGIELTDEDVAQILMVDANGLSLEAFR